ncbi:hypothetical protein SAY86_012592 [Trapa natans]|uniref:Glutaredoxin domain-containing protein n=1 Tax=Trapa natans TaxID=22666 RepID=A0AAN7RDJ1_TRANT|nr:hypothetical protein SAY86_012592 [Trapa natans]
MGCGNSKQRRQCRHCQAPYSPVRGSSWVNNESQRHPYEHESHHVEALKLSILGSLKLEDAYREDVIHFEKELMGRNGAKGHDQNVCNGSCDEFLGTRMIEAKTWSQMMEEMIPEHVPMTPVATPPGEPETINTWELMEGLEDVTPSRSPGSHVRSCSLDVVRSSGWDGDAPFDQQKSRFQEAEEDQPKKKSMWFQMTGGDDDSKPDGFVLELDPSVISSLRRSFQELSPRHPFHIRPSLSSTQEKRSSNIKSEKVIVYFTSLRGIRKTYEDCCHVLVILKGIGVRVDERDVSMHSGFKEELKELLGEGLNDGSGYRLPRVFVGKSYIGGAEEIRRLHEEGNLEKLLGRCERADGDDDGCEACGDIRFVPCDTCSGSCKIICGRDFVGEEKEEEQEDEEEEFEFQRCPDCNENGLIRCPICCCD